jgi:hypothetical protein
MDPDQTPINGKQARDRGIRAGFGGIGWALRERLIWPLGDGARTLFEIGRWPFERLAWALQRALVWPLKDRAAALSGPGRVAAGAGAAVAITAIAVALVVFAGSGGSGSQPAAAQVAVAPAPETKQVPPTKPAQPDPTLHGAAPVFKAPAATKQQDPSEVDPAQAIESSSASSSAAAGSSPATDKISSDPSASSSSAGTETAAIPGRPAGPEAIAVARDFSKAFVVYETGGEESGVRATFAKTTTTELAKALLKRPPRLPANVKVPKAKVVNVVPGPSREGVYTLSVSLLRVGVTSELRLEMEQLKNKGWRVTNVLG